MPVRRYETEELDQATLDYLHLVVDRAGRGLPGLYFAAEDAKVGSGNWPLWAVITGPIIVLLTLATTWGSTRSPVPVALLMTAGLFLGGWLIIAWLRAVLARQGQAYVGYFKYVDPRYLWCGRGTGVEVQPIDLMTDAEAIGSRVRIDKPDGDVFMELRTTRMAGEVEEYLTGLCNQTARDPAERGYAVMDQLVDEDERDEEGRIETIPSPTRARPSRGWVTPLILLVSLVLLFFFCKWLATYLRDGAIFEEVQDKDPAHLRLYLADPRNTRFRAEVLERLQGFHNQAADKLEQRKGDRQLIAALAGLIRALGKETSPVITVAFEPAEKGPTAPEGYLSPAVLTTLQHRNLVEMSKVLQPLARVPGSIYPGMPAEQIDLLELGQVSEGPAMMTITAKITPGDKKSRECRIDWTIRLQADPDAQKHVVLLQQTLPQPGDDPAAAVRGMYGNLAGLLKARLGS